MNYLDALAAKPPSGSGYARKSYLDLSTAHLRPDTRDMLDRLDGAPSAWPAMSIFPGEYGWVVTVPPMDLPDVAAQMDNMPSDLADALSYAFDLGCELIRFDSDGYQVKDLPFYED